MHTLTPTAARRLAIVRQHLAGTALRADTDGVFDLVRELGCLQLDPTNAVARSHLLVLWSRLGPHDPAHLDALLWRERRLFEYWAHAASIVCTEDYPTFRMMQRRYGTADSPGWRRFHTWLTRNDRLRRHVLGELRRRGPLPSRHILDLAEHDWRSTGWTAGRNVERILSYLWRKGRIMIAGRSGGQRLWDLAERCLPPWTPRARVSPRTLVRSAAERALRSLGAGTARHIQEHFIRGCYLDLPRVLADLEAEGRVARVVVADGARQWPGTWYAHREDLPLIERLERDDWTPRTTLLSPFDNLICDRARTELLFEFVFRLEIYVPKAQRTHGFYVMPVLHGDRLIGRVDQAMDRAGRRLVVSAVHAEARAPSSAGRAVAGAIESLAAFLGAETIEYGRQVPRAWRAALR